MEEEAERIRRESLKPPVNGDVLTRVDSIDDDEEAGGGGGGGGGEGGRRGGVVRRRRGGGNTAGGGGGGWGDEGDTESSESKQKKDEGLGESFDRNSELSDRDSFTRSGNSTGGGSAVEMQPLGDSQPSSYSPVPLPPSPLNTTGRDGEGASPEDPRLSFLDSSAAKRVTFM